MNPFTHIKDLYYKVQESDVQYLLSEITDTLNPSIKATEITHIVCLMLEENVAYVKKNGLTEPAKISRERLLKLLDITELFNTISGENHKLKLLNKNILAENQTLKAQLNEVKRQENIGKSI